MAEYNDPEECDSCGGPAHPDFSDGMDWLCPECSEERDMVENLTDIEVEELFKDSPISLAEWERMIIFGVE